MSGRPDLAPATSCLEPESVCKNHAGFLDCLVIMLLLTGNLVEVAFLAQLSSTASTLVVFAAKTPVRPPRPCTSDAGQTVPNLSRQRPVGTSGPFVWVSICFFSFFGFSFLMLETSARPRRPHTSDVAPTLKSAKRLRQPDQRGLRAIFRVPRPTEAFCL